MKITLDLSKRLEQGRITPAEAERLTALAAERIGARKDAAQERAFKCRKRRSSRHQSHTRIPPDFVSTARRPECDEDKARFENKLGKIARAVVPTEQKRPAARAEPKAGHESREPYNKRAAA